MQPIEQNHEQKTFSQKLKFCPEELARLYEDLNHNESFTLQELRAMRKEGNEVFNTKADSHYYLNREDLMKDYFRRYTAWQKFMTAKGAHMDTDHPLQRVYTQHKFNLEFALFYLHYHAFLPALELLTSEEQYKKWVPAARNIKIFGAYAQTELGHGSDVQGLQTTATFDVDTQEFVFHTPSTSSIKFYPGGLGKNATHVILYARLISQEKDHGVQAFLVQVRDMKTHTALPGVEVGDCGPKIGFNGMDNGYLKFNQVRQPRDTLLAKYVQIKPDGAFVNSKNSTKLAYGGMLNLRIGIVYTVHYYLAKMATIGTRYSFLRRQFENKDGSKAPEALIIQYQMQQYKITPAIATSWAFLYASGKLFQLYDQYKVQLNAKGPDDADVSNQLGYLHGLISGLKPAGTWLGEYFGETIKQACGGHGYLEISGLPRVHIDFGIGNSTAEGDGTVLLQQTAMILIKNVQSGLIDLNSFSYDIKNNLSMEEQLALLYEIRYKGELKALTEKIQSLMAKGHDLKNEIINDYAQVQITNSAKYFVYYFMVQTFLDVLNGAPLHKCSKNLKDRSPEIQVLMRKLFKIFSAYFLIEEYQSFYMNLPDAAHQKYYVSKVEEFKNSFKEDLSVVSMSGKDLVNGFDYSDDELLSVIAKKGYKNQDELYEEMINVVRKNPLNKNPVAKGFNQYMRPILLGKL